MDFKIKVPEVHKPQILLWTDVSCPNMEVIDNIHSISDLESALCSVLDVDHDEPKRGVLLELYVQAVLFFRKCNFRKEQSSVLLSIIKSVHKANIETPLNNVEQCFSYCKELLLCHSVRQPPFSINLFTFEEANCILKYIYENYIRQYKLYKYIFTPEVKLDLSLTYSGIPKQEESFVSGETQMVPRTEESPEAQETSITEQEETTFDSTSQLKTSIE